MVVNGGVPQAIHEADSRVDRVSSNVRFTSVHSSSNNTAARVYNAKCFFFVC